MNSNLKNTVEASLNILVRGIQRTRIGQHLEKLLVKSAMKRVVVASHNGLDLRFSAPTSLDWRINTFSTKEPETLEWIDSMPYKNSVLWDVGANIGLYSVYAAKKRGCKVWAFEPSVFNLELLARNIFLNGLTNEICIVPIALTDKIGSSKLRFTTTDWGGALSTFGEEFGWDGRPIKQVFEYSLPGLTMDYVVNNLKVPQPDYLKIDVDGIEHLILSGGMSVIKKVKEILVEVNDDFRDQADQCDHLLSKAGLKLREKRHSDIIANSTSGFANSYNQIWAR